MPRAGFEAPAGAHTLLLAPPQLTEVRSVANANLITSFEAEVLPPHVCNKGLRQTQIPQARFDLPSNVVPINLRLVFCNADDSPFTHPWKE